MSAASMPKTSTSYANLHVPEQLHTYMIDLVTRKLSACVADVKQKGNPLLHTEFEIRLGKFEKGFVPGVSYEEFSRFYTYLENNENYKNYILGKYRYYMFILFRSYSNEF